MRKLTVAGIAALLLTAVICIACFAPRPVKELTYAVYPYIANQEQYEDLIEERWKEIEPDIRLTRCDYNCYHDTDPGDIDVIMYDAIYRDTLIENNWIRSVGREDIEDPESIYPFALEGMTVEDEVYGIPVFLCGNFLIYDKSCTELALADHITDLADEEGILLIATEDSGMREEYYLEAVADILGTESPGDEECPEADEMLEILEKLAIDEYESTDPDDLPGFYSQGVGMGYFGFSETMPLLEERFEETDIRQISFSDRENIQRFYVDAVAINANVSGERYDKCVELINVIADADILSEYSDYGGEPKYLMLARKDCYNELSEEYPLYGKLEELASNDQNTMIR